MIKKLFPQFFNRVKNVFILNPEVYLGVERAFLPALVIVLLVALSHGAGGVIRANYYHWDTLESFVLGFQGEVIFWLVQSFICYAICKWILGHHARFIEVLSVIGFTIVPGILVVIAAVLQPYGMTIPLLVIIAVYRLLTCVIALRIFFSLSLPLAIIIAIISITVGFFSLGLCVRVMEGLLI